MPSDAIKTESFQENHVLFREGDSAYNCYIIKSGEVELSRYDKDRQEIYFATIKKGEILGEMSMILGTPRTATARAIQNTEAVEITKEDFDTQIEQLKPFMQSLIRLIVQRLSDTTSDLTRG